MEDSENGGKGEIQERNRIVVNLPREVLSKMEFRPDVGSAIFGSPQIAGAEFIRRWPVFDECVMEDL